jgi:D-glycero-D-manno-heptose 1,7-bisphosphate phosphatase
MPSVRLEPPRPAAPRRAVFLDRDGTLIEYVPELVEASRVRLLPGAAEAVRRFRAAGWLAIVVTNQPVLGRGLLDEAGLAAIHAELDRLLAREGARIDAYYVCPVVGEEADRTVVEHPDRKPGPGLLLRAARDHGLDLAACFMVGDSLRDLLAGRNAGCRGTILVRTGLGERELDQASAYDHARPDLRAAADTILADHD